MFWFGERNILERGLWIVHNKVLIMYGWGWIMFGRKNWNFFMLKWIWYELRKMEMRWFFYLWDYFLWIKRAQFQVLSRIWKIKSAIQLFGAWNITHSSFDRDSFKWLKFISSLWFSRFSSLFISLTQINQIPSNKVK
jgi:hypothetical protein